MASEWLLSGRKPTFSSQEEPVVTPWSHKPNSPQTVARAGTHFHAGQHVPGLGLLALAGGWGRGGGGAPFLPQGVSIAPFFKTRFLVKLEYAMRRRSFVAEI